MILDLNKIKRSGKTKETFFFEYDASALPIDLPGAKVSSPVSLNGEVLIFEDGAQVSGEIVYTICGNCTRCLTPTEKTFDLEFSEECGGEDGYPIVNGRIDLKKIVDDAIILNTPVSFLCSQDCKGLCPTCGANLNDGKCKCNN